MLAAASSLVGKCSIVKRLYGASIAITRKQHCSDDPGLNHRTRPVVCEEARRDIEELLPQGWGSGELPLGMIGQ
jgi:hypothetical protein